MASFPYQDSFRIRTVTCFVCLRASDFATSSTSSIASQDSGLARKVQCASDFLRKAEHALTSAGYTVQTLRIATNPFGEWMIRGATSPDESSTVFCQQLDELDSLLDRCNIQFCSLGPAVTIDDVQRHVVEIVAATRPRFSCSAILQQNDVVMARQCAATILQLSRLGASPNAVDGENDNNNMGLGNFRFAVAASVVDCIPFFPVAKAAATTTAIGKNDPVDDCGNCYKFSIGLENGVLAHRLLAHAKSIRNIPTVFGEGMAAALAPIQQICRDRLATITTGTPIVATVGDCNNDTIACNRKQSFEFVGIDTSLNPSLDQDGSIAAAIECLEEVCTFGGLGTLAAAATVTQTLQSLQGIQHCGYSGIMLPVCEDTRLSELTVTTATSNGSPSSPPLSISSLLSISQVCGVGIDTVPIPGDCTVSQIASLLLDVTGIAHRWSKSLSCRVFPIAGKGVGEWSTFDSPFLVNAQILPL